MAMPEESPPPPYGTIMVSTSGRSSRISSPIVPFPGEESINIPLKYLCNSLKTDVEAMALALNKLNEHSDASHTPKSWIQALALAKQKRWKTYKLISNLWIQHCWQIKPNDAAKQLLKKGVRLTLYLCVSLKSPQTVGRFCIFHLIGIWVQGNFDLEYAGPLHCFNV